MSALCGLRDEISWEAQAAAELEARCAPGEVEPYPFACAPEQALDEWDLRPTVRAIAADLRRGVPSAPRSRPASTRRSRR